MLDIIIKNGKIYDGTGSPPFVSNIGIAGNKILHVQRNIEEDARIVIDAEGLIVSPGFVDIHSHSDYYLLINPMAESKVRQGVTTEIGGNCGYSPAPIAGPVLEERKRFYSEEFGIHLDFKGLGGYLSRLENSGISVNFASQIGHNTIRGSVVGLENKPPACDQMLLMKDLIDSAMQDGAFGISLGLIYPPSCYSDKVELIDLCKIAAKRYGVLSTHIRSEGRRLVEAVEEVIEICEQSEIPLQISHLKTSGKQNWGKIDRVFDLIESAIDRGLQITCDRYPYTASNTGLLSALPEWVYEGGTEEVVKRLCDRKIREKIKKELREIYPADSNWERVMISQAVSERNKIFEGKNIKESSYTANKECAEFVLDILAEEDTHIEAIYFSMCEENLERILKKPYVMIGSDSGARADYGQLAGGKPHPRTFGSFPRVIKDYAVEKRLFDLSTAIKKMTSDPCRKFKINGRGLIKEGMYADIVIFDLDNLSDTATYQNPYSYPSGIRYVLVNGEITVEGGQHTGKKAGKALRTYNR